MNTKIQSLFTTRDNAVFKNDLKLFLSTQLKEIDGSSSAGYLATERMKSTVVHVHHDIQDPNIWIILVREDYFKSDQPTHHNYLIYTVIDSKGEPIIQNIRW